MSETGRIEELEAQVEMLRRTLATLITWMAQSANSPINSMACIDLLDMLPEKAKP